MSSGRHSDAAVSADTSDTDSTLTIGGNLRDDFWEIYSEHIPEDPLSLLAIEELRIFDRFCRKWTEGKYETVPSPPLLTVILEENKSISIAGGIDGLDFSDKDFISLLAPIADKFGISIGLAELTTTVVGQADDDGDDYYRRHPSAYKRGYESEDSAGGNGGTPPPMGKDFTTTHELSNLISVSDGDPLYPDGLEIGCDSLSPQDPFEDEEPDDHEYQGYLGEVREAGELTQTFRRSVLVLYRDKDGIEILSAHEHAHPKLKKLALAPTANRLSDPSSRKIAYRILEELNVPGKYSNDYISVNGLAVLSYAVRWKDSPLFFKAIPYCTGRHSIKAAAHSLAKAVEIFPADLIKQGFASLSKKLKTISEHVQLLEAIASYGDTPELEGDLVDNAIASYQATDDAEASNFVWLLKRGWFSKIQTTLIPKVLKEKKTFRSLLGFAKALHENKADILLYDPDEEDDSTEDDSGSIGSYTAPVAEEIHRCISAAIPQWAGDRTAMPPEKIKNKAERICQVVNLCLTVGELDLCKVLFNSVRRGDSQAKEKSLTKKVKDLYGPLTPRLTDILRKHKKKITSQPFRSFLKRLIGLYLTYTLGTKSNLPQIPRVSMGCTAGPGGSSCEDCRQLGIFANNTSSKFSMKVSSLERRVHLERRIDAVGKVRERIWSDLPKRERKSEYKLGFRKREGFMGMYMWEGKQVAAVEFLKAVGEDRVVKEVMGNRYGEVTMALAGEQPYEVDAQ